MTLESYLRMGWMGWDIYITDPTYSKSTASGANNALRFHFDKNSPLFSTGQFHTYLADLRWNAIGILGGDSLLELIQVKTKHNDSGHLHHLHHLYHLHHLHHHYFSQLPESHQPSL